MIKNKLLEPVDDPENYIFYAVRNAKAEQMFYFLKQHFLKKGFNVNINFDMKFIKITLINTKKSASWDEISSYIWLKDISKKYSFNEKISNFLFSVKDYSITSHIGTRTPKIIENFWQEIQKLVDDEYFENNIAELNYPFSNEKSKNLDVDITNTLQSIPQDFISVCLDSGFQINKQTFQYIIETFFAEKGFIVEGQLAENDYLFTLKNTKRGDWNDYQFSFSLEHTFLSPTWDERIYYGKSLLKNTNESPKPQKETKLFKDFYTQLHSNEFKEFINHQLFRFHYPFRENFFLSC